MATSFANTIDDEGAAALCRGVAITIKHLCQPNRIAYGSHGRVNYNDPPVGDLQCPPIARCWNARHVDNDVMKLGSQDREQRVDRRRGELHVIVQRFLAAEHKQPLAVLGHQTIKQQGVKPLTRELLTKTLAPQTNGSGEIAKASSLKLGKMVSFIGARGGVGTTTLAANLAWHLANRQARRVALVDLDLQHGDCHLLFNLATTPGLRDALANPLRLDALLLDRLMTQHGERLFVLGGEEPLHEHVEFTTSAIDTLFSVLRSQFHYVIVDVPRIPTPGYRRALEIADRRIVVLDPTMRSMRDAVRLAKMLDGDADPSAERRSAFIVNRDGETGRHGLSLTEITKVLQVRPTSLVPFLPSLVTPAAHHATVATSKRGKFADAIGTLAVELSGRKQRRRWFSWRAN